MCLFPGLCAIYSTYTLLFSDLVRDIESLIDVPSLQQPELIVKGEKLSGAFNSASYQESCSVAANWNTLLDDLNIGSISEYLDTPLNGIV